VAPFEHAIELEMEVARDRFRSRVARLVIFSIAFDVVAAVLAYLFERGSPRAFGSVAGALFWTTTQLLTVSSQLPNPERTATKVLDVVLEAWALVVVTALAGSFADVLHHRTRKHVHERRMSMRAD
jgi:hypothetical protein